MPTRIQFAGNSAISTTVAVTLPSAPTNGNTLIAYVAFKSSTAYTSGITQTGATWTRVVQHIDSTRGNTIEVWVASNVTGASSSISIIPHTPILYPTDICAIVTEYSGISNSSPLDQTAFSGGTGSGASSGTTGTTSQASELWVSVYAAQSGSGTAAIGSPTNSYSSVETINSGDTLNLYVCDLVVSSAGTAGNAVTLSSDSPYAWTGAAVTFLGVASSVTVNPGILAGTGSTLAVAVEMPGIVNTNLLGGAGGTFNAQVQTGATQSLSLLAGTGNIFSASAHVGTSVNTGLIGGTGDVLKFVSSQGSLSVSTQLLGGSGGTFQAFAQQSPSISMNFIGGDGGTFPVSAEIVNDTIFYPAILAGSGSVFAATTNIGPTIQPEIIGGSGSSYRCSVSVGVTLALDIIGSNASATLTPSVQTGTTQPPSLLTGTGSTFNASAQSGNSISTELIGGTGSAFGASVSKGVSLTASFIGGNGSAFSPQVQASSTVTVSLLGGTSNTFNVVTESGKTLLVQMLGGSGSILGASVSISAIQQIELIGGAGDILRASVHASSTFVPVSLVGGSGGSFVATWSSVGPSSWTLSLRQQILYTGLCQVYRKSRNSLNDVVYQLIYSNVPCYIFTTPNRDVSAADVTSNKEPGIFLFNRLAMPVEVDIRTDDMVYYQGPQFNQNPSPDTGAWFAIMGSARNRPDSGMRQANKAEYYLNPNVNPPLVGVQ